MTVRVVSLPLTTTNKTNEMKNLVVRTITGVLFVAALVASIVYSPYTFGLMFLIITALSTIEFCSIVNRRDDVQVNTFITTLASVCLFLGVYAHASGYADAVLALPFAAFMPYIITMIYLTVSSLYINRQTALASWAFTMMSQVYVALPFSLLSMLSFMPYPMGPLRTVYVWIFPLAVFLFLWCSDTGAYCVGSLLGKKIPYRLFPSISPNKSWVGSIGGCLLTVTVAVAVSCFDTTLTLPQWIGFGLVVCVFGTWGDLVESLVKRQLGIKDSGHILPGHGGMLDRFDSSLLAIPAALVYVYTIWSI